MKYTSTRGGLNNLSFEDVLFSGYLSDGGLAVPEAIPQISLDTIRSWASLSYGELVKKIVPYFIDEKEISKDELNSLVDDALSRFDILEVMRTKRCADGLAVLELFHGPTLAFKDLALGIVGHLYSHFLKKRKRHVNLIIGTSGDTGSAAIESVRGLAGLDVIVLLPKGRCTRVQQLQMTTVCEHNVHIFAVDGNSDELDEPIREVFKDLDFVKAHGLCSINSINWVRILVQIAHFFYAYFQIRPKCDGPVEIIVPTGACGNVTGGLVAIEMGLPLRLTCAVNENNIVYRTISKGDMSMTKEIKTTLAPAMDIQMPYNMERLVYLLSDRDVELVKNIQKVFEETGKATLPEIILNKMAKHFRSYVASDEVIVRTMQRCYQENGYLLCPHTCTAVACYYNQQPSQDTPRICIATASPAKFEEAVSKAGLEPQTTKAIQKLANMPEYYTDMARGQNWEAMLRECIVRATKMAS